MASTKDILSAQKFNRARLLTAFQSGMPEGRELTPTRPWGGLIGGLVLSILLFGVSWVSTLFAPSLPDNWEHGSLVTDQVTGARYVSIEGTLYPVRNASSAHLLFPGNLRIVSAGAEALRVATIGVEVGIDGAPDQVPTAEAVTNPSLLTCTATGTAPWTGVNTGDSVSAGTRAVHVVSDGQDYLVSGGFRHKIGNNANSAEAILTALSLPTDAAKPADATWLSVFPEGEPLAALSVPDIGTSAGPIEEVGEDVAVGTLLEVSDTANAGMIFVVKKDGLLEALSPVKYQLYAIGQGSIYSKPLPISSKALATRKLVEKPMRTTWPDEISGLLGVDEVPCGHLDAASPEGVLQLVVGSEIPVVGQLTVAVAPQSGAILQTQTTSNLGYTHLVDESGTMFTLNPASETLAALRLDQADVLTVPLAWRDLFEAGPTLSTGQAWQTVPESAQEDS